MPVEKAQATDDMTFESFFSSLEVAEKMRAVASRNYAAVAGFWTAAMSVQHLTPRMRELVLLAMHGSASALNVEAIKRQAHRVLQEGGTHEDISDVLTTIVSLANHALYSSVPVLDKVWSDLGKPLDPPALDESEIGAIRQRTLKERGFWNPDREPLVCQMPEYFKALTEVSSETWRNGPLTQKEREFVCIAIDCNLTHSYPPGLELHIKNAIKAGATKGEILEIFQLAALLGVDGYVLAAEAMFAERS